MVDAKISFAWGAPRGEFPSLKSFSSCRGRAFLLQLIFEEIRFSIFLFPGPSLRPISAQHGRVHPGQGARPQEPAHHPQAGQAHLRPSALWEKPQKSQGNGTTSEMRVKMILELLFHIFMLSDSNQTSPKGIRLSCGRRVSSVSFGRINRKFEASFWKYFSQYFLGNR